MRKIGRLIAVASAMLCLVGSPALAYDWNISNAHVTLVVAEGMPNTVSFMVDQAGGACPAGYFLTYTPSGSDQNTKFQNANAVYSGLISAMISGRPVSIYGNNTGCTIDIIHLK